MANEDDDNNTEWDFKVDNVKTEEENVERKRRKERLAKKLGSAKEEEARDAEKDLLGAQKSKRMGLGEAPSSSRKSRARIAKEMADAERPDFSDLMAGPVKRLTAGIIDGGVFAGSLFAINMFWEQIELKILTYLRENNIDQPLDPETFKLYLMIVFGVAIYFVLIALPAVFTGKSWGKTFTGLGVVSADEEKELGISGRFFREVIAKPISLATVVGPLFMMFNGDKRGLHDLVSGTSVMDFNSGQKKKKKKRK